ncbi:MAG TPA: TetR/AcrR family transcriptional regulator [Mycobacterium sp.]|nr:TetR/AcrR family transcriptional regulator [Mycobacterium sp.]
MVRAPDQSRRRQLLDKLVEEFARGGIGDRSLRDVAAAVGTSHRMLLHHFGSREELLIAVVEEAELRQMALVPEIPTDPAEGFAAMWADLRRPELRHLERLFFECYSRAAQGEEPFTRIVPGAVDGWLREVEAAAAGVPYDGPMARLGLAVTRGLLLDLVATEDEAGVDAAAEAFVQLLRR